MPIFEYRCRECGTGFEALALPGRGSEVSCPGCGSENLEKVFSTFSTPTAATSGGLTCCGREERCDSPPCDATGGCRRH